MFLLKALKKFLNLHEMEASGPSSLLMHFMEEEIKAPSSFPPSFFLGRGTHKQIVKRGVGGVGWGAVRMGVDRGITVVASRKGFHGTICMHHSHGGSRQYTGTNVTSGRGKGWKQLNGRMGR